MLCMRAFLRMSAPFPTQIASACPPGSGHEGGGERVCVARWEDGESRVVALDVKHLSLPSDKCSACVVFRWTEMEE